LIVAFAFAAEYEIAVAFGSTTLPALLDVQQRCFEMYKADLNSAVWVYAKQHTTDALSVGHAAFGRELVWQIGRGSRGFAGACRRDMTRLLKLVACS